MQIKPQDILVTMFPVYSSAWGTPKMVVSVLHKPTNTEIRSSSERSAHANKHKAFQELIEFLKDTPQQLELDF